MQIINVIIWLHLGQQLQEFNFLLLYFVFLYLVNVIYPSNILRMFKNEFNLIHFCNIYRWNLFEYLLNLGFIERKDAE